MFEKELKRLKSSAKQHYSYTKVDPKGEHLVSVKDQATGAGYELKHHIDSDVSTEVKLKKGDHIVRLHHSKMKGKTGVVHSLEQGGRALPEDTGGKYATEPREDTQVHENATHVIDMIATNEPAKATGAFSQMVADRAYELVNQKRDELAKTIFSSNPAGLDEPEEDEVLEDENLDEDRIGQTVRIDSRRFKGDVVRPGTIDAAFHGKTGVFGSKENGQYRVHLHEPVHIEGVGHVHDDLWDSKHLKKV